MFPMKRTTLFLMIIYIKHYRLCVQCTILNNQNGFLQHTRICEQNPSPTQWDINIL